MSSVDTVYQVLQRATIGLCWLVFEEVSMRSKKYKGDAVASLTARQMRQREQWPWRVIAEITETSATLECGHRVPSHLLNDFKAQLAGEAVHEMRANCRRCYQAMRKI